MDPSGLCEIGRVAEALALKRVHKSSCADFHASGRIFLSDVDANARSNSGVRSGSGVSSSSPSSFCKIRSHSSTVRAAIFGKRDVFFKARHTAPEQPVST